MAPITTLHKNLKAYKKKYYTNMLYRGSILCISSVTAAFLAVALLEYVGHFDPSTRAVLFYAFIAIAGVSLVKWVAIPVKQLVNLDQELSDEEASRQIGQFFPSIKDKLLNTLQLHQLNYSQNELILASIEQKTQEIGHVPFTDAVSYKTNNRYLKRYLAIPLLLLLLLLIGNRDLLFSSSERLIRYNQTFIPPAPFTFSLQNEHLQGFRNEAFTLNLGIDGQQVPQNVYLVTNGRKHLMTKEGLDRFNYSFSRLTKEQEFHFEAAGFTSPSYTLELLNRPVLEQFFVDLNFPAYLKRQNERIENIGSLTVPEGTQVSWTIKTQETQNMEVFTDVGNLHEVLLPIDNQIFNFSDRPKTATNYDIHVCNEYSGNKEQIGFSINVIEDRHPQLTVEQFQDTVLYEYLLLGGSLSDDYGISRLQVHYRLTTDKGATGSFEKMRIPLQSKESHQNFYYQIALDSLGLAPGSKLEYFVQVWDNDGVNGPKATKSSQLVFEMPSEEQIEAEINQSSKETNESMESTLQETQKFSQKLSEMKDKLQTKRELNWQDRKDIENLLNEHKSLTEQVEELKEKMAQNNEKYEQFNEENQELSEKAQQLQELMESLLDEETKKLMEELQKLMEENSNIDQFNDKMEELENQSETLEKELDRTLEMYKQLQFDRKLQETIEDLDELAKEQEELSEETKDGETPDSELQEKQEELNEEFEKVEDQMNELHEMNESLEKQKDLSSTEESQEQVKENQQKSSEQLQQNKNKKASESQKNASDEMKKMAQEMKNMQASMQQQQMQENMDDLRDILENLITLSFDQERLMKDFQSVKQSDPRFVTLSQEQLKLRDDAQVIEDSLFALAKRVFEIKAVVTKEVGNMKKHMNNSTERLKQRKPNEASGEQQFAMTSMNNLALMLDDVLQQMQQNMAQQMQGEQMCNKPGQGSKPQNLGQMQQQLNQMIQDLKNGQKSGRQLSEQLAKLAAQQEMIRRAMQGLKQENGLDGKANQKLGDELQKLEKMMEQTEEELVNKKLSERTVRRQKDILTRLLEAEKAARERDLDEKREAKTAEQIKRKSPHYDQEYLKNKEKQIELLKTIPPNLNPYYKKEANEYFQSIEK